MGGLVAIVVAHPGRDRCMPYIRYIPLPLVKVHRHINDAPIGTLLQIATGDLTQGAPGISPIAVGMRCQLQTLA